MAVLLVTIYAGSQAGHRPHLGNLRAVRLHAIWRLATITGALLGAIARYLLAAGLVMALT
jgi:predicted branched-subunit amino acid permease